MLKAAALRGEGKEHVCLQFREVLGRLQGQVQELKLYQEPIAPLELKTLEKRTKLSGLQDYRDPLFRYAKQFAQAEDIVIAAPYWDLSFPSVLKEAAYAELYPRIRREAVIYHGIAHHTPLADINDHLFEENEKALC